MKLVIMQFSPTSYHFMMLMIIISITDQASHINLSSGKSFTLRPLNPKQYPQDRAVSGLGGKNKDTCRKQESNSGLSNKNSRFTDPWEIRVL
jgi:hypothetical protein